MSRRKVLYTDVPRPYDADAMRLAKIVGFIMTSCLLLAVFALIVGA